MRTNKLRAPRQSPSGRVALLILMTGFTELAGFDFVAPRTLARPVAEREAAATGGARAGIDQAPNQPRTGTELGATTPDLGRPAAAPPSPSMDGGAAAASSGAAPLGPAASVPLGEAPLTAAVFGEPVSPDTCRRFPHLSGFQGHILLGGQTLQIVLAGIPVAGTPSKTGGKAALTTWSPAVLAVFTKRAEGWRAFAPTQEIALRHLNGEGVGLVPVGVDVGSDPQAKAAYASFIYGIPENPKAPRQIVTWRYGADKMQLTALFDEFAPKSAGVKPRSANAPAATGLGAVPAGAQWQVRISGEAYRWRPVAGAGQLPYVLAAHGADVVATFGLHPYASQGFTETGHAEEVLTPLPAKRGIDAPLAYGLEMLFNEGAGLVVSRAGALQACLYGEQRPRQRLRPEGKLDWLVGCDGVHELAQLTVTASRDEQRGGSPQRESTATGVANAPTQLGRAQAVYVVDGSGQAVAYVAVAPGEHATVNLPPGTYHLSDTPYGRVLGDGRDLVLTANAKLTVDLATPLPASLYLRLADGMRGGSTARPALLTLVRLDDEFGELGAINFLPANEWGGRELLGAFAERGQSVWQLSPQTWLIRSWPVELTLAEGAYGLTLARGKTGVICQSRAVVTPGRRTVVACGALAQEAVAPPMVQTDSESQELHIAEAPVPSEVATKIDPEALALALGLDYVITRTPPEVSGSTSQAAASGGGIMPQTIAALTVHDAGAGTTLSYLPATTSLAARWTHYSGGAEAESFRHFGEFLHQELHAEELGLAGSDGGIIELGCPGSGSTVSEYVRLGLELQATHVHTFGCGEAVSQVLPLVLSRSVEGGTLSPAWMTAESATALRQGLVYLPHLVVTVPHQGTVTSRELVRALSQGAYTLSAGGTVTVTGARAHVPVRSAGVLPKTGRKRVETNPAATTQFDVRIATAPGVRARTLLFYTEAGIIGQVDLGEAPPPPAPPLDALGKSSLSLTRTVDLPQADCASAQWLRVEVRGTVPNAKLTKRDRAVPTLAVDPQGGRVLPAASTGAKAGSTPVPLAAVADELIATTNFQSLAALLSMKRTTH